MTRLSTTSPTCSATSAILVANASQTAALIWHALPDLNWAGFYFFDGTELVVGPFQGLPACTRIALTRGVCGAAASRRESIVVPDVHAFPGHIACDSRSRSELVVPIVPPAARCAASSTWTRRPRRASTTPIGLASSASSRCSSPRASGHGRWTDRPVHSYVHRVGAQLVANSGQRSALLCYLSRSNIM